MDRNNNDDWNATNNGTVFSSLPLLARRALAGSKDVAVAGGRRLWDFLLPNWESPEATVRQLIRSASSQAATPMEFLLRHFDTNRDGHISRAELLNMTEVLKLHMPDQERAVVSWATWFRREWPLMDWKIGVFLWSTFGGVLFLLAGFSIIPGRMHAVSAKLLRWPVLGV